MGGRGTWSETAKGEKLMGRGSAQSGSAEKIPASQFQTISGNRVSKSATFANVERKIAQNGYETGVIVDGQGFVVAAYKGGKNSVNFGSDFSKIRGNIVTHNHPSNAAAFSVADIMTTGEAGGIGIRATTKSNGTAVLAKASNSPKWGKMASAYDGFLSKKRTVAQAQDWLSKNAPKYGLTFRVER